MINRVIEELRNIWDCLNNEQSHCGALLRADFSYGTAILTAPKPLLDKALSKGGGG